MQPAGHTRIYTTLTDATNFLLTGIARRCPVIDGLIAMTVIICPPLTNHELK